MKLQIKSYLKANIWVLLTLTILFFLMFLSLYYLSVKHINLLIIIIEVLFGVMALSIIFFMVLSLNTYNKGSIKWLLIKPLKIFNNLFYPMLNIVSNIIRIDKEQLKLYFIEINNILVQSQKKKFCPKDILLLIPHCLQNSNCKIKITNQVTNCKKCGTCNIGELLHLSEQYGVIFHVVSGGTFARKIVFENKPKMIVSVACERDLLSGIQDVNNIPVIGILNIRNNGPCFNTSVDVNKVEEVLKSIII